MKQVVLLFLLSITIVSASSQQFQKTYSRNGSQQEIGQNLIRTADNGYVLTGYSSDALTYYETFLLKTDSIGDTLWTLFFSDTISTTGYGVIEQDDGSLFLVGTGLNIFLSKVSMDGDTLWNKNITSDSVKFYKPNLCKNYKGGVTIVMQSVNLFTPNERHLFIIDTDSSGNIIWAKSFDNVTNADWNQIKKTNDSGFIIVGTRDDANLLKIDSLGNFLWSHQYDFRYPNRGVAVAQTNDNGFIIGVRRWLDNLFYQPVVSLIKTDWMGNAEWGKTYNGDFGGTIGFTEQTQDGGYIFLADLPIYTPFVGQLTLVKTDNSGDTLWTTIFPGGNILNFISGCYNNDNTYSIFSAVQDDDSTQIWKSLLIKTDSSGKTGCVETFRSLIVTSDSIQDYPFSVNVLNRNLNEFPAQFTIRRGIVEENFCLITNVKEIIISRKEVSISPNPFTTKINVQTLTREQKDLQIFNLFGVKVIQMQFSLENQELDLSLLPAGVYVLNFTIGSEIITKKLIKY